jgi:hypothetical protein
MRHRFLIKVPRQLNDEALVVFMVCKLKKNGCRAERCYNARKSDKLPY